MTDPKPEPIAELWATCANCGDRWQNKDLLRDEKWRLVCWACDVGIEIEEVD